MRKLTIFKKRFSWWTQDSNSHPSTHVLPLTPSVNAFVRRATDKRFTNRLQVLSQIHAVDSAHSSDALVASGGSVRSPLRAGRNSQGAQRVASPSAGDPQVPRGGLALTALHASG